MFVDEATATSLGAHLHPPPLQTLAPELEGYVCLVDHTLAQREVGVGQVGEGLQQDLRSDGGLEEGWVELVPEKGSKRHSNSGTSRSPRCTRYPSDCPLLWPHKAVELGRWTCLGSTSNCNTLWLHDLHLPQPHAPAL